MEQRGAQDLRVVDPEQVADDQAHPEQMGRVGRQPVLAELVPVGAGGETRGFEQGTVWGNGLAHESEAISIVGRLGVWIDIAVTLEGENGNPLALLVLLERDQALDLDPLVGLNSVDRLGGLDSGFQVDFVRHAALPVHPEQRELAVTAGTGTNMPRRTPMSPS